MLAGGGPRRLLRRRYGRLLLLERRAHLGQLRRQHLQLLVFVFVVEVVVVLLARLPLLLLLLLQSVQLNGQGIPGMLQLGHAHRELVALLRQARNDAAAVALRSSSPVVLLRHWRRLLLLLLLVVVVSWWRWRWWRWWLFSAKQRGCRRPQREQVLLVGIEIGIGRAKQAGCNAAAATTTATAAVVAAKYAVGRRLRLPMPARLPVLRLVIAREQRRRSGGGGATAAHGCSPHGRPLRRHDGWR